MEKYNEELLKNGEIYIDGLIGDGFKVTNINGEKVVDNDKIYPLYLPGFFEIEVTNFDPSSDRWILLIYGKMKESFVDIQVYSEDTQLIPYFISDRSGYYFSIKEIYEQTQSLHFKIKVNEVVARKYPNEIFVIKNSKVGRLETPVKTIKIIQRANKISYLVGETFDPTGMVVEGTHLGGYKTIITDYNIPEIERKLTISDEKMQIQYQHGVIFHPIEVVGQIIKPTITNYSRSRKIINWTDWEKLGTSDVQVYKNDNTEIKTVLTFNSESVNFDYKKPIDVWLKLKVEEIVDGTSVFQQFYASNLLYNITNKKEIFIFVGEIINKGQEITVELTYNSANITFKKEFAVFYREPKDYFAALEHKDIPLFSKAKVRLDINEGVASFVLDDFSTEDTDCFIQISHCFHPKIEDSYYGKHFNLNINERLEFLNPTSKLRNPVYTNAFNEQENLTLTLHYYKDGEKKYLTSKEYSYLSFSDGKYYYQGNEVIIEYVGSSSYFHYLDLPNEIKESTNFQELITQDPYENRPCHWLKNGNKYKGFNLYGQLVVIMDCFQNYVNFEYDDKKRIKKIYKPDIGFFLFSYNETTNLLEEISSNVKSISYQYNKEGCLKKIFYFYKAVCVNAISIDYQDGYYKNEFTPLIIKVADNYNGFEFTYQMDSNFVQRLSKINNYYQDEYVNITYGNKKATIVDQDLNQTIYELNDSGKIIFEYGIKNNKVVSSSQFIYNDRSDSRDHVIMINASENFLNKYPLSAFKRFAVYENGNSQTIYYNNRHQIDEMYIYTLTSNGACMDTQVYTYDEKTYQLKNLYHVTQYKNNAETSFYIKEESKFFYLDDGNTVSKKCIYYSEYTAEEVKTDLFVDVYDYHYDTYGNLTSTDYYRLSGAPEIEDLTKDNATYSYLLNKKEYLRSGQVLKEYDVKNQNAVEYQYVPYENNIQKQTYGDLVLNYSYDPLGRMQTLKVYDQTGTLNQNSVEYYQEYLPKKYNHLKNYPVEFSYDDEKRIEKIKINGQIVQEYTYVKDYLDVDNKYYDIVEAKDSLNNVKMIKESKVTDLSRIYINQKCITEYQTDALGRISSLKDYYTKENNTFVYNPGGALKQIKKTSSDNSIQYSEDIVYDDKDRVIKETSYGRVCEYTYKNKVEDLVTECKTDKFNVTYDYNIYGTLKTKTINLNNTAVLSFDILHDEQNYHQITTIPKTIRYTLPNFFEYEIEYDNQLNISILKKGNIIQNRFFYDSLNRLIREDNYDYNRSYGYSYDSNGNLIKRIEQRFTLEDELSIDETEDYVYSKDKLISYNGESIEYNTQGNMTKICGDTLKWNERNLLSSYKGTTFEYDASGLRVQKNSIQYFYDVEERLIKESRGKNYFYDHQELIGIEYNNKYYVYIKDPLGNIVALLDESNNIVARYIYDAWGNHQVVDDYGREITDSSNIGHINPFRYKGYYYDKETDLYYLKSRYYSPKLKRFISPDSIKYLDPSSINGLNLYIYCGNDPVNRYDPTGHSWKSFWSGVVDWFSDNWVKLAIGAGAVALGVLTMGTAALISGAGIVGALSAMGTAAVSSLVQVGISTAISAGIGLVVGGITTSSWDGALNGMLNGIADGIMWGGIFAGAGQVLSGAMKITRTLAPNFNGIRIGNLKIWSPNSAINTNAGGTIFKFGKFNRIDAEIGNMIHIHLKLFGHTLNHLPIGMILGGILGGF